MIEIVVNEKDANQRLDKYVRKVLNKAPLDFIYKTFRKKDIKINGKPAKKEYILKADDVLRIYIKDEVINDFHEEEEIKPRKLIYPVIYEDDNILIVNKPKGLIVHRATEKEKRTLTDAVLSYLYLKGEYDPKINLGFVPGPAHRLDRNTSGLVVFGKNLESLQELYELFKNKDSIEKHYLALVVGSINNQGEINAPLLKDSEHNIVKVGAINDGAKNALTYYSVIDRFAEAISLVDVQIVTGRTHQIRVHLAYIGAPVVGDGKYGNFEKNKVFAEKFGIENQFLHAYRLKILKLKGRLSYLSNMEFKAPLFSKEQAIIDILKEHK